MKARYVVLCLALMGGTVWYSTSWFGDHDQTEQSASGIGENQVAGPISDTAQQQIASPNASSVQNGFEGKTPHLVAKPAFPKDLAANFDALKSKAEHGDSDTAYVLANALMVCNTQTDVEKKCRNISQEQIAELPKLLDMAASQGNVGAQLAYGPMVGQMLAQQEGFPDEDAMRTFKYKTMTYLNRAAAQGSVEALNRLALQYQNGTLAPKDPVTAYAYMYATSKTGLIPTSSKVLSLWSHSLSRSDMTTAVSRGEAIYRSCCVANGPSRRKS